MNNLTVSAMAYLILFCAAYKIFICKNQTGIKNERVFGIVMVAAVVAITGFKVYVSSSFFGHSSDMSLFSAWADLGRHESVSQFYGEKGAEYFVDYPPLYLYVLTAVGRIAGIFNIPFGSDIYVRMIKFIPIVADTALALLIYKLAQYEFDKKTACILSFLVLLNPACILNSVVWGQIDGLFTLIILWLIISVFKKRYFNAVFSFTVGMLIKPQMLIFLPLLGFWLLWDVISDFYEKKQLSVLIRACMGIVASAGIVVVSFLPIFGLDFSRIFSLYKNAASQYPYASLNAANIFGAFGLNWADLTDTFLGISYQNWGFMGIVSVSAAIGIGTYFCKNRTGALILGGFTVLGIFMLAHTMHERYMYPLILILLVIYIYTKDRRMLYAFLAATVLQLFQTGAVLLNNEGIIVFSEESFIMLSWIHVLFSIWLTVIFYKMLIKGEVKPVEIKEESIVCIKREQKKVRLNKKDALIIAVLTVVYGVSAFFNLGSMSVPETGYYPEKNGETILLDFGEEKNFGRINLFAGLIARRNSDSEVERVLTFSFGIDASEYEENPEIVYGDETVLVIDSVFRWDGFFANQRGRFLKLSVDEGNFFINEIACFDENGNLILPTEIISDNETACYISDEHEKVKYEYTWYDGTYFDEIYHPRTAYEYINGLWPYENTHPPLGKLIIALGMMIFGVTPFGWRFFGTLAGVLMVPLIYIFGKQLLKDTKWAAVSCFLFTFDFMHLTQTRLATIDSFTVLFVILMYYFMYRYVKLNFYNTGVLKTLPPLFLSGLFFGIGVAVKWQGVYAGIGLCIMFFAAQFKRFKEYKAAKEGRLVGDGEKIIKQFMPSLIKTLVAALVFFVIVPFVIYFLSYLPIILSDTADISYFWENQMDMLSYHSQLTEKHPYGSPWWTWPLDIRPLYAYNPNWDFVTENFAQGISSFGNPLVWWMTIPSVACLVYFAVKGKGNTEIFTVLTGFGAMYLPWVMISRQAFIYHFFPCVVFVVFAIALCFKEIEKKYPKAKHGILIYLICVFVLYVGFYPVLTGIKIPGWYAECLSWLPSWVLG